MARATDEQVQRYSDWARDLCNQMRRVLLNMEDFRANINDVYEHLNDNPTWTDTRTDDVPHLLTPADMLAINTFVFDAVAVMRNHGQLPVVLAAPITPLDA